MTSPALPLALVTASLALLAWAAFVLRPARPGRPGLGLEALGSRINPSATLPKPSVDFPTFNGLLKGGSFGIIEGVLPAMGAVAAAANPATQATGALIADLNRQIKLTLTPLLNASYNSFADLSRSLPSATFTLSALTDDPAKGAVFFSITYHDHLAVSATTKLSGLPDVDRNFLLTDSTLTESGVADVAVELFIHRDAIQDRPRIATGNQTHLILNDLAFHSVFDGVSTLDPSTHLHGNLDGRLDYEEIDLRDPSGARFTQQADIVASPARYMSLSSPRGVFTGSQIVTSNAVASLRAC